MDIYFFTFGLDDGGGWTKVVVAGCEGMDTRDIAIEAFSLFHPRKDGFVACSMIYSAEQFNRTKMRINGNFGNGCVETITINRRDMA